MEDSHFEEQEESIRVMDLHRNDLVAEAREVLAQHPGVRLVGVVITGDSREAEHMRAQLAAAGGVHPAGAGFVMLMPREQALQLLRATTPAQLDWLDSEPGRLPLVCVTRSGTRLGWAPLDPS